MRLGPFEKRERSIVIHTAYGDVVMWVSRRRKRLQIRLLRCYYRGGLRFCEFTRPSPRLVQLVCTKHFDETRGKGGELVDGEGIFTMNIHAGVEVDLDTLWRTMLWFREECEACGACHAMEWHYPECENMCEAEWSIEGFEVRPVPPQTPAPCIMQARNTRYGHVMCQCEPYEPFA